jgi:hypothetical protein
MIAANIKGDIEENRAAQRQWHTSEIREGYARFLLVVLRKCIQADGATGRADSKRSRRHNFKRAFSFFRPGQLATPNVSLMPPTATSASMLFLMSGCSLRVESTR